MAAGNRPEHAAALVHTPEQLMPNEEIRSGGVQRLKDVLQAVQLSVVMAEQARVELSGMML